MNEGMSTASPEAENFRQTTNNPAAPKNPTEPEEIDAAQNQFDRKRFKSQELRNQLLPLTNQLKLIVDSLPSRDPSYQPLQNLMENLAPKMSQILALIDEDNNSLQKLTTIKDTQNQESALDNTTETNLANHWQAIADQLQIAVDFIKRLEFSVRDLLSDRYDRDHPVWRVKITLLKFKEQLDNTKIVFGLN